MATTALSGVVSERYAVFDWDLEVPARDVPPLRALGPGVGGYVLVRLAGRPAGRVILPPALIDDFEGVQRRVLDDLGPALDPVLGATGLTRGSLFGAETGADSPTEVARRGRDVVATPAISVVVCTRERPDGLRAALGSLLAQTHADFEVLVVDNAPTSDASRAVVDSFADPRLRYVREDTPGLSVARNRALREIDRPVVAWLDDDETADPDWLAELATGFTRYPDVAAVSGFVFPAELDTAAQVHYESYGGHSKGRLMVPEVFDPADRVTVEPLFPVPPFGVGANMAFRTDALRALGGFDEALGAGTRTQGGEDTLMFSRLLLAGRPCLYFPSAVTRHVHRRDMAGFTKQMYGYGTGLSAFYVALLAGDPRLALRLPRLLWRGLKALRGAGDADSAVLGRIPADASRRKLRGFLAGPLLYLRARREVAARRRRSSRTG